MAMRQLLPSPVDDVEPYDVYRTPPGRGLVRINMASSIDGRVTAGDGLSGGLTGAGDLAVFEALRALADGVLVGAGTARAEGYGPYRPSDELVARRSADGRLEPAAIILVSRSLELDPTTALFTEAQTPTIVLTAAASASRATAALRRQARLIVAGDDAVDLAAGVRILADEHGIRSLLCEGGPSLNTALWATGLVDELCVTLAPTVTGADGPGIVAPPASPLDLDLRGLCEQDGELYARYGVQTRTLDQS
jgi:riboflavin-specific deaminase-like protein